ncbi:cell adhesion molecule 4 [Psammomys obesus]|uniref:cell adhesion molecule 4 n=1 Tax=Psammomys obesus TaxID=48139 RepID=UPI002453357E|nr:cell adhesion molecule 4 [Psammomys obesus]
MDKLGSAEPAFFWERHTQGLTRLGSLEPGLAWDTGRGGVRGQGPRSAAGRDGVSSALHRHEAQVQAVLANVCVCVCVCARARESWCTCVCPRSRRGKTKPADGPVPVAWRESRPHSVRAGSRPQGTSPGPAVPSIPGHALSLALASLPDARRRCSRDEQRPPSVWPPPPGSPGRRVAGVRGPVGCGARTGVDECAPRSGRSSGRAGGSGDAGSGPGPRRTHPVCLGAGTGQEVQTENVTVAEGGVAEITCRLHQYDGSIVVIQNPARQTLFFNGTRALKDERFQLEEFSPRRVRIRLSDARLEDEGGYFCQLYTEDTHHQIATLTVLVAPENPVVEVREQAVEGGEVELSCLVPRSRPAAVLRWYRDRKELKGVSSGQENGKVWSVASTVRFRVDRKDDGGIVVCEAQNQALPSGHSKQTQYVLDVQYSPTARIHASQAVVREGDTLVLTCAVTGNPRPSQIRWNRGNESLPERAEAAGETLTLPGLVSADNGTYTCEAANKHGHARALYVLVVYAAARGVYRRGRAGPGRRGGRHVRVGASLFALGVCARPRRAEGGVVSPALPGRALPSRTPGGLWAPGPRGCACRPPRNRAGGARAAWRHDCT